jgi:hypothetical protein
MIYIRKHNETHQTVFEREEIRSEHIQGALCTCVQLSQCMLIQRQKKT